MWPYTFLINTFKALCWMQIYSFPLVSVVFTAQSKASRIWIISHLHYLLYWGHLHLGNWGIKKFSKFIISECPTWDSLNQIFYTLWYWILYYIYYIILYYINIFSKHTCWRRGWCPGHSKKPKWPSMRAKIQFFPSPKELCCSFKNVQQNTGILKSCLSLSLLNLTK